MTSDPGVLYSVAISSFFVSAYARLSSKIYRKLIFRQSDRMAATHQLKARDLFSVKGYVCVVTGGGTGIGLMATQALAANGTLAGKK